MRLGLLVCDHVAPEYQPGVRDYPELFDELLRPHIPDLAISLFEACRGDLPSVIESCDAYLCTGSRSSSFEEAEWISQLKRVIRLIHESERPFVGICFGHQVLAEALGGEVRRAENGWGVGVHTLDVLRQAEWMSPPAERVRLPYMHQDQVTRLPAGGTVIGRTDHCPVAAFLVGPTMLGIQGHPEFPRAYSEALIRDRRERIGPEKTEEALRTLSHPADESLVAGWIAEFFSHNLNRTPQAASGVPASADPGPH